MTNTTLPAKTRKILIVEDEGEMCLLLNILLDAQEMELDHVKFLSNAVEYLQKEKPAVVLLDNKLPDGYGVDFISYIKKNSPDTKVIMISGFDSSARDVAMQNGADDYIEKPFTRVQLFESIRRFMN